MAIHRQTFEQQVQYAKYSWNMKLCLNDLMNVNPRTLSLPMLVCFFDPLIEWMKEDKISCPEVLAFFQGEYDKLCLAVETKQFSSKTIDECLTQISKKGSEVFREEEEEEEEEEDEEEDEE